jgi:hypothetical protein
VHECRLNEKKRWVEECAREYYVAIRERIELSSRYFRWRKGAHLPRYHFVVTWRDRVREYGNTEGTILQDEEEARRFAARIIRELKQAGEHDDPELCLVVKDAQGREVFTLSF